MASSLILYLFCYDSGYLSNDNRKKSDNHLYDDIFIQPVKLKSKIVFTPVAKFAKLTGTQL